MFGNTIVIKALIRPFAKLLYTKNPAELPLDFYIAFAL